VKWSTWRAAGRAIALAGTVGCVVWGAAAGAAEIRVLEVVGAVPLDQATRASGLPKDRALEEALWEGVSRVASDLLVDSIVPEPEDGSDPVRAALGDDTVPYTRSFRIVEDQGERPMLFTEHPDAATEYVVVVEVQVEVDKVRDRLVAAGLLVDDSVTVPLTGIRLEVRDLAQYGGYQRLIELLESDAVGAVSVSPLELARDRLVLHVEAEWGATELLERLLGAAPDDLRIRALEVDDFEPSGGGWRLERGPARLVISVQWTGPPAGDEAGSLGRSRPHDGRPVAQAAARRR
jgi:hypothetical protein